MSGTTKLWIFNIVLCGALVFMHWYRKNGEKMKTRMAEKNLNKSGISLKINSESIEAFLSSDKPKPNSDYIQAKEYLVSIRAMLEDPNWVIDSQNAIFKTKNRTKDRLLSVRATCDLYVSDKLIYTLDFTRSNIPVNGSIEVKQNIVEEYDNAVGALTAFAGAFSKKLAPKTEGRFRNYEIEIAENHYLFNNPYIRKAAGEKPIVRKQNDYERLITMADSLDGEAAEYVKAIISALDKSIKYSESNEDAKKKVSNYINKYIPTINDAINSYSLNKTESSNKNLVHTLKIMDKATKNFYGKLIETDLDASDVNQTVLEQQLMREGLYNPYDDEYFE